MMRTVDRIRMRAPVDRVFRAALYRLTARTAAMQDASPPEQFQNTVEVIHSR